MKIEVEVICAMDFLGKEMYDLHIFPGKLANESENDRFMFDGTSHIVNWKPISEKFMCHAVCLPAYSYLIRDQIVGAPFSCWNRCERTLEIATVCGLRKEFFGVL
jgi:hypothetical protein